MKRALFYSASVALLLSGCANSTRTIEQKVILEAYVIATEIGWTRAKKIALLSGDDITGSSSHGICFYEKRRDLHQCIYKSVEPSNNYCAKAKQTIEEHLRIPVVLRTAYSKCLIDGGLLPPEDISATGIALIFDATVSLPLVFHRIRIGIGCRDGEMSHAEGKSGACSHHGGVSGPVYMWRYQNPFDKRPYIQPYINDRTTIESTR